MAVTCDKKTRPFNPTTNTDHARPLINVSELRAFVYCERSWCLDRQGFLVSPHTQADRDAGTVFHEHRAIDAVQGDDPRLLRSIYVLLALAAVLLLAYFVQGARRS